MNNATTTIQNTVNAFAIRQENAEKSFIESIMVIGKCTQEEAEKVLRVYYKLKIVRVDVVFGQIKARTRGDRPFHEVFIRAAIEYKE